MAPDLTRRAAFALMAALAAPTAASFTETSVLDAHARDWIAEWLAAGGTFHLSPNGPNGTPLVWVGHGPDWQDMATLRERGASWPLRAHVTALVRPLVEAAGGFLSIEGAG